MFLSHGRKIVQNFYNILNLLEKVYSIMSRSWKSTACIAGFVGFIGLALYPIIISPMIDCSEYKEIQKEARKNIRQEDIQPGNMKVWSDPFERKKPQAD